MRPRLRRLADTLHRWLGLSVGLILVASGLTGACLSFYVEIERRFYPSLRTSAPHARPVSYEAVFERLSRLPVDPPGLAWRIEIPAEGGVVTSRYDDPPRMVSLDPLTLNVLRDVRWRRTFFTFLYDIHMNLLFGPPGKIAMGWIALVMVLLLVCGLGTWLLPPGRFASKFAVRWRGNAAQRTYGLHKTAGYVAFPLLALLALTGAAVCLPDQADAVAGWLSPPRPALTPANPPRPSAQARRLPVDEILRRAEAAMPGLIVVWINVPTRDTDAYLLKARRAGGPYTRFPRTRLVMDQFTGTVLAKNDPLSDGPGDAFLDWIIPLHEGNAFGTAGRVAVMVTGLVPALLFATGILRWRQKRTGALRA